MKKYYVYSLFLNGNLIYVGSTTKPINRLKDHKLDKDFNMVLVCRLENEKDMLDVEKWYIKQKKPTLNKNRPEIESRPDVGELEWVRVDLSFLHFDRVESGHSFDDFCHDKYLKYCAESLGMSWEQFYNLTNYHYGGFGKQCQGWNYDITSDGYLVIKHDLSGKNISQIMEQLGNKSYESFCSMLRKHHGIISEEQYYASLDQFN